MKYNKMSAAIIPAAAAIAILTSCSLSGPSADSETLSGNSLITTPSLSETTYAVPSVSENADPSIPRTYILSLNIGAPSLTVTDSQQNASSAAVFALENLSVTYYKTSFGGAAYDNVNTALEDGTLYLEITPDISDSMLTDAYLSFELPEYECYFYNPSDASSSLELTEESERPPYLHENGSVDLTQNPVLYITDSRGNIWEYPLLVRRQTYDIPTLFLTTDTGEDVTSRYEYVSGNLVLDNTEYNISIRGRGNASWWKFPQKSYMLKFDERISLFGMLPSEKWVLASTYGDLSLIRNCVAMDIAACMDNLEYTPRQIPVDVYLNGSYLGVYTFSEKIDTDIQKVDLFSRVSRQTLWHHGEEDIGFLLECGGDLFNPHIIGQEYFYTAHSPRLFVNYPVFDEPYTEEFNYISDYMNATDQAITRGYGYEEYIDLNSWIDWFIVMELTNNTDSAFCRSTYLYKRPGEKLMLGPVWDFDMAMGNFFYDNQTYAYWATAEPIYAPAQNHYMTYLYESDDFMLAVRERWDEIKDELLNAALDSIDRHAEQVAASRIYNNHIRGVSSSGYQIDALRSFIQRRYDWIDMSIHMSDFNRHPATESVPQEEEEIVPPMDENGNPVVQPLDENGNPVVQPLDENGNPVVQPLDENGNPVFAEVN